ncbi:hypothetical protein [Sorangium sp. So ce1153]|uniref:hypothetical protein n=1 Tax=Sorangium sp. So ce1153 TaxID=3133333 RepID=UPI003F5EB41A
MKAVRTSTSGRAVCSGARYAARTTAAAVRVEAAGVELPEHQRAAAGIEVAGVEFLER